MHRTGAGGASSARLLSSSPMRLTSLSPWYVDSQEYVARLANSGQNFGMAMPGWYDIAHLGRDVNTSLHPFHLAPNPKETLG